MSPESLEGWGIRSLAAVPKEKFVAFAFAGLVAAIDSLFEHWHLEGTVARVEA